MASFFLSIVAPSSYANAQISIAPTYSTIETTATPQEFRISNPSEKTIDARVSWIDLYAEETGTYRKATIAERKKLSAAPLLKVSPAQFTLAPGTSMIIKVWTDEKLPQFEKRSHLFVEQIVSRQHRHKISSSLPIDMSSAVSVPIILRRPNLNTPPRIEIQNVGLSRTPEGNLSVDMRLKNLFKASKRQTIKTQINVVNKTQDNKLLMSRQLLVYPELDYRKVSIDLDIKALQEGQIGIEVYDRNDFNSSLENKAQKTLNITPIANRTFRIGPPAKTPY